MAIIGNGIELAIESVVQEIIVFAPKIRGGQTQKKASLSLSTVTVGRYSASGDSRKCECESEKGLQSLGYYELNSSGISR